MRDGLDTPFESGHDARVVLAGEACRQKWLYPWWSSGIGVPWAFRTRTAVPGSKWPMQVRGMCRAAAAAAKVGTLESTSGVAKGRYVRVHLAAVPREAAEAVVARVAAYLVRRPPMPVG